MNDVAIKLELSVVEVNTILRCLGKHPFDEIASLIGKIKMQGESQLAELQSSKETAEPTVETSTEE